MVIYVDPHRFIGIRITRIVNWSSDYKFSIDRNLRDPQPLGRYQYQYLMVQTENKNSFYINFFNLDEVRFSSDNMMRIRFDLVPNWNPFLQYSHYYEKLLCVYRMFLAFVLIWILYLKENVLKRIFFVTLWHFWHFFASSLWYSDYKHFLW